MTNNPEKHPVAVATAFRRDRFNDWLIPPFIVPAFLLLLAAAYGLYRAAA